LLHAVAWHLPLTAPDGGDAHLSLRVGELDVIAYETPIPAPETPITPYVEVAEDMPAGTPIYFHVHNHGDNAWRLLEVSTGTRADYDDPEVATP
jgi:hypothetical protein